MADGSTKHCGGSGVGGCGTRKVIPIAAKSGGAGGFSGCSQKGGAGRAGCGSAAAPAELPPEVWEKVKDHPCYSEQAHHHFARMHVAVAPACNIQCNYCNRKYDCANESRPGVVSEKLTPEQAVMKVLAVASQVPQLSVVGIAGPGDALANPGRTFATFREIQKRAPDIKLCLSTNGLALPDHVDEIHALGVDHVTITINMTDPEVGERIYPWIFFRNRRYTGREASRILAERQMEGLERLREKGILAKINSVMIPGVNDEHLAEVNRAVNARGAFLHNIMPLISDPAHGTHFGLSGQRGPTPAELKALQDRCEGDMRLMRHCRQCRADAVGLLGEDRSAEFTTDRLPEAIPEYDTEARRAYRAWVEKERADQDAARGRELMALAPEPGAAPLLVAVATRGGGRINEHFGHAREFQVYEVDGRGARFVGHRRTDLYCQGGFGDDAALEAIVRTLEGVSAVLVAKVGHCPRGEMQMAGIEVSDDYAFEYVEASLIAYYGRRIADAAGGMSRAGAA
ncbi:MAG TPA: nitrogenase cofactor biosynthesis protein NifB [Burkholderiales bacterium]